LIRFYYLHLKVVVFFVKYSTNTTGTYEQVTIKLKKVRTQS